MSSQVEKDFLRLIMMLHEIVLPVCKDYFKTKVLTKQEYNGDLKTFLEKHKHDIYHLVHNVRCCQCGNSIASNNNNKRLFAKQFDKFYAELDAKDRNHVKWGPGNKIKQQCICGHRVLDACSVNVMDISTVNAIVQTCLQGMDYSHSMWLNKIVEQRNELCHLEDLNRLTINETNEIWKYLEGSTLGLAGSIPPEGYKESIEKLIKSYKRIEFQREEVKPVLDSMIIEYKMMKECVESMKEMLVQIQTTINGVVTEVPQQMAKLEECMVNQCRIVNEENEAKKKEIQNTVMDAKNEISEQIGAQAVITSSTITESRDMIQKTIQEETKKQDEKLDTILQEVKKGNLHHRNQQVEFNVKLCEQGQNICQGTGDVFVTWKISKHPFAEKEQAEIIQNIRKVEQTARQTAALWLPDYKIELISTGSIVIATLLNKDVLRDNEKFESSIRLFLDRFLVISGIDCTSPCTIDVNVVISEGPLKVDNEETNKLLAKYFDKIHQVVPEMLEESSEGVVKQWIELPLVYSLNLSPIYYEFPNNILLIFDISDADLTRQIVEMLPRGFIMTQKKTLPHCLKGTICQPRTGIFTGDPSFDYLNNPRSRYRYENVYVVIADTHTKRTAIKVALELLQLTTCIALVPCDGFRYNDISTESIVIDKDLKWQKSLLEKIQLSFGLNYRRYVFVPPMMASEKQNIDSISIVIVSSVLDHDKMNIIYRALKDHIGHNVYFKLVDEMQISINEKDKKLQFGESNCILVLSDHSKFLSRILKMVDPIVASFSKGCNAPGVAASFYSKTFAQDLLSIIVKKNKKLPCFTTIDTSTETVSFCSLMRDKQLLFEVREQVLARDYRKTDVKHFVPRTMVVLLSGEYVLDDALRYVESKYQKNTIKLFLTDVPNKDVTDDNKSAFYDDLLSRIRNIASNTRDSIDKALDLPPRSTHGRYGFNYRGRYCRGRGGRGSRGGYGRGRR